MTYEIVELAEKTVVGLEARTNNGDESMGMVIGGLWQKFYGAGIYEGIQDKTNGRSLGIYTEYEGDETSDYTFLVACEVNRAEDMPEGTVVKTIPAGKYARFIVKGHVQKAVMEFWQELWKMDLPRAFGSDFEEYQDGDMENAEIHIYIGLK
ncbi:AraC family transcriptional regulator [Clostridium sp. MCC353]|uniref:GyrI-like domain-containing protein n=1 Tax=Clostridium sp. MCC353 TaxID=2592646 RepID=UPI001C009968|nr:GyrI-like domain-containing protein [Clostridium sp. MCC353]MBT9776073.1 AraC family transcriptional regulator [Clostridium sp. MCC353]